MELTEVNLEEINDAAGLVAVVAHAQKVVDKTGAIISAYANINNFTRFVAELKNDGLVHIEVNGNQPAITVSPGDFNLMIGSIKTGYLPGALAFATEKRSQAVEKLNDIINPEPEE